MGNHDAAVVITPYLRVHDAAEAIAFYERAFGAIESYRLPMPDGTIAFAEIHIGAAVLWLADESPGDRVRSPQSLDGTSVILTLSVPDVDAVYQKAVEAGATAVFPVSDQFYGYRDGRLQDPFGHTWIISTKQEDLTPEEMERRMAAESE